MNIIDAFNIIGSQAQVAAVTSAAFALTPGTTVVVTNEGATNIVRVAFGGSVAVAAVAASMSVPVNSSRQFSVRNGETFIAIKTDAATSPVNISTGEGIAF